MKQIKFLLALLCIHISVVYLSAQSPHTDSLESLLKKHRKADTGRVNLLNETALDFYLVDNTKHLAYAEEALELASSLKYEKGRGEALRISGLYHYNISENQQALELFQESLTIFKASGYKKGISLSLNYLGMASWKLGNITQAMEYIEESYAIAQQLGDKVLLASCLKSFGILYLVQGDYALAIDYFQEAIVINEELGDIRGLTDCLNNIGYIHMRQGNNLEALAYFRRNVDILEEVGDKQGVSSSYINTGIIHQHQGNFPEAIEYYEKARVLFEEFEDKEGISKCLNNIGLIYESQGRYPQALEYIQNALKIKEETGDKRDMASCLMNIGGIHENQNNSSRALEYYEKSLAIFEELGDKQGISNCLIRIGNVNILQGNYSEALGYFQNALLIKEELGDKYGISSCLVSMGTIFANEGDNTQALTYYQNALKLKEELADRAGLCLLFLEIGKVYLQTNKKTLALDYTNKSLALANELDLMDAQKKIHKQLSDIYFSVKNYRKAYENHALYKVLYDSIYNVQEMAKFTGLEYQYTYEKEKQAQELEQQKKDAIHAEEDKRQKLIRNSFIIGFVLMLMLLFAIQRSFLQKRRANRILARQKQEIELQNIKITDSIEYAKRIQSAVFPPVEKRKGILPDHFVLHRPCDIVSGDFYWMAKKDNRVYIAVADCTGHGVPGAFMSMLGVAFLCEIVNKKASVYANGILNELRGRVIHSLHQTGKKDEARDGMEMALCIVDFDNRKLQFAGAYRPLYIIRKQELIELKADKMPIGIFDGRRRTFTNQEMMLDQDDCLYLSTDGYADQIGGPKRKSFKSKYLKELLLKIHKKEMREQHRILDTTIEKWRGEVEQIDDMLLLGIRV